MVSGWWCSLSLGVELIWLQSAFVFSGAFLLLCMTLCVCSQKDTPISEGRLWSLMAVLIFNGKRVVSKEQQAGAHGSYKRWQVPCARWLSGGVTQREDERRSDPQPLLVDGVRQHRIDVVKLFIVRLQKPLKHLFTVKLRQKCDGQI